MLDQNDRKALCLEAFDKFQKFCGLLRIHTCCRLIEKKELCTCCDGTGNLQLSLLAVRQVSGIGMNILAEAQGIKNLTGLLMGRLLIFSEPGSTENQVKGVVLGILMETDHNILNGLGSAVCEVAAEMGKGIVKRVGIQDQFGQSAPYERLLAMNGVTVENITEIAETLVKG